MFSSKIDERISELPVIFIGQIEFPPHAPWKFSIHYMPVFKGLVFYVVNHCKYKSSALLSQVLHVHYSRIPMIRVLENIIREAAERSVIMEAEKSLRGREDVQLYYANNLIAYFEKPNTLTIASTFHKIGEWYFMHDLAASITSELESLPL